MNFPLDHRVRILEQLKRLPFSTINAEQPHAAAAMMHRHHPDMQLDSVQCRSMAYFMRALLTPPPHLAAAQRLRRLAQNLGRCQPAKVSGRHIYLRECMAMARRTSEAHGGSFALGTRQQIMRRHSEEYLQLSLAARATYERMAAADQRGKLQEIQENVLHVNARVDLLEERAKAEIARQNPFRLRHCAFDSDEVDYFAAEARSSKYGDSVVDRLRKAAADAPSIDLIQRLEISKYRVAPEVVAPRPDWLAEVCCQREHFHSTAFRVAIGDPEGAFRYFGFLFAMQKPYLVGAVELAWEDPSVQLAFNGGFGAASLDDFYENRSSCIWGSAPMFFCMSNYSFRL